MNRVVFDVLTVDDESAEKIKNFLRKEGVRTWITNVIAEFTAAEEDYVDRLFPRSTTPNRQSQDMIVGGRLVEFDEEPAD